MFRARSPPPTASAPISNFIEPNGSLGFGPYEYPIEIVLEWDRWRESNACEHPGGVLLHHYLGNISLIALLRGELEHEASRFPLLLTKVIYNGVHTGDFIPLELLPHLRVEVNVLADFKCRSRDSAKFLANFRAQNAGADRRGNRR